MCGYVPAKAWVMRRLQHITIHYDQLQSITIVKF